MSSEAKQAAEVIAEERHEIRRRRAVHRTETSSTDVERDPDLSGIALSGGGIRAAAFSLGFVQSMYSAGRLKAFDYLSTVSGGGYAGGLISSTIARQNSRIDWERNGTDERLSFEYARERGQPDSLRRLALHGRLMGNFLRLFSRHLWGFMINVT
ncbi:MAG: patatin-like phospholipase family protein, partial [Rubripirellula sp.]